MNHYLDNSDEYTSAVAGKAVESMEFIKGTDYGDDYTNSKIVFYFTDGSILFIGLNRVSSPAYVMLDDNLPGEGKE